MRALVLLAALALTASACDTLDDFSNASGSYAATVRGARSLDLSGWGYLGGVQDDPPITGIILTHTNSPTFRFEFPADALQPGVYTLPDQATATFEIDLAVEPAYTATSGQIEITSVADGVARGTFSFAASRPDGAVTASGTFVAE